MLPSKEKGFMSFKREVPANLPVGDRIRTYHEFSGKFPPEKTREQAFRCMNCGVPFCHFGCPLGNVVPDFNDLLKDDKWREACDALHATNNFPEFTGRVCPALCEASCVLGLTDAPVTIEYIERAIVDRGWDEGYIKPQIPKRRTGKTVAVVGSGPAGLAAAQQLNRAGHTVTVFERDDEPGGLLTYGIPAFKLSKEIVRRRINQLRDEGVQFNCNIWVGRDIPTSRLEEFDAVLLTMGSTKARTLDIPGADLDGIHLAVEFLKQQTRRVLGKKAEGPELTAKDKHVIVIGGGDTGSDCVGTSIRQGAASVHSIELLPKPPLDRDETMPWPYWPSILRTSTSHEEGGDREWSILTKAFSGDDGHVKHLHAARLEWSLPDPFGRRTMKEIPNSEFLLDCDLVLLALGFLHPEQDTVIQDMGLDRDTRGNIKTDQSFATSRPKVYAAGDTRRGQSLVVWAIHEGREAARWIDIALMGRSDLPSAVSFGYDSLGPTSTTPGSATE
ncbi:MAG TPA: glutamate synthase subunit beta [Candidatus Hydrogenedentes bacterium]|nr:glutamate synthase subunit beta [Candidatus Hydrogenedentota bacterium]HPG66219.1 glutamate synthase subunit beta [Candidatus Hydrogenedentota bacterium]